MNPLLTMERKAALAVVAFILALGFAGRDDVVDAQLQGKAICTRSNAPIWCHSK